MKTLLRLISLLVIGTSCGWADNTSGNPDADALRMKDGGALGATAGQGINGKTPPSTNSPAGTSSESSLPVYYGLRPATKLKITNWPQSLDVEYVPNPQFNNQKMLRIIGWDKMYPILKDLGSDAIVYPDPDPIEIIAKDGTISKSAIKSVGIAEFNMELILVGSFGSDDLARYGILRVELAGQIWAIEVDSITGFIDRDIRVSGNLIGDASDAQWDHSGSPPNIDNCPALIAIGMMLKKEFSHLPKDPAVFKAAVDPSDPKRSALLGRSPYILHQSEARTPGLPPI